MYNLDKMKMTPLAMGLEERGTLRLEIVMSCVAKMVDECALARVDYAQMS